MLLNLLKKEMDSSWLSCGEVSSDLLIAAPDGDEIVTRFACLVVRFPRK